MTAPSPKVEQRAKAVADIVVRDVCELPDRSSPEDEPGMLLVTTDELHMIVTAAFERDLLTRSGGDHVLNAHPYDVLPVEYRPDNYRDPDAL